MLRREPLTASLPNRARHLARTAAGEVVQRAWDLVVDVGAIGPRSPRARRFGSFGEGTIVCFPLDALVNEHAIHLGAHTMIAPHVALSAGWGPGHPGLPDEVVRIGDRCLVGRGSSVVAHLAVEIGDDVWTGPNVYITDMNHDYTRLDVPISQQAQPEAPVRIGDGSWLGTGAVVLPGSKIGRHVTVGAGSVVNGHLPDHSVAVGSPARVVRRHDPEHGWVKAREEEARAGADANRARLRVRT
jgi:acetyltransferase-like isoleucine patch superfamily enzyme